MSTGEKLTRADLMSLEAYAEQRNSFRDQVLAHKAPRRISLNPNATLIFEDRLTIQYQIQEMLRVERIFEAGGIEEELAAYNPLIPDGDNWKATMLIEYPDVEERKVALEQLRGVEHCIWASVPGGERVLAIANEDLERSNDTKTAAVHFLRFQFDSNQVQALRNAEQIHLGVEHANMQSDVTLSAASASALLADLNPSLH